jgi:hypothetical protein
MFVNHRRFEMRRSMRLIAVLLVVAVGFGASAAFGTTGSSTAGSLSFTVTLPDNVTAGQYAAWTANISNGAQASALDAQVTFNLSGPGISKTSPPLLLHFAPGKSFSRQGSFRVPAKAPAGAYTLTMSVNAGNNGSGQAIASSTVAASG